MNKIVVFSLKILLTLLIIFLGYRLYDEIFSPWKFEKAKNQRYKAVRSQMDEIVKAQNKFKDVTGTYAGSWDTLAYVLVHDSIMEIRSIGATADTVVVLGVDEAIKFFDIPQDLEGEDLFNEFTLRVKAYNEQLRQQGGDEILSYKIEDTTYVPAIAQLHIRTAPDSLKYIPYGRGDTFILEKKILTVGLGRVQVPVYKVVAYNESILRGLDERYYEPKGGIRLGSLEEATTDIQEFEPGEE